MTQGRTIGTLGRIFACFTIFQDGMTIMTGKNSLDIHPGTVDLSTGGRAIIDIGAKGLNFGSQRDLMPVALRDHGCEQHLQIIIFFLCFLDRTFVTDNAVIIDLYEIVQYFDCFVVVLHDNRFKNDLISVCCKVDSYKTMPPVLTRDHFAGRGNIFLSTSLKYLLDLNGAALRHNLTDGLAFRAIDTQQVRELR